MNRLRMPSHSKQLGMTKPFHECTCNRETRQGQMGRVHELDGNWHKKATEAHHPPESEGKTEPLSCAVPLLSRYVSGSTGKIHWNCLYSCSIFKWWSTVGICSLS